MSSKAKVLYVGMTNNIERRMYEHKNKMNIGFTAKYNVNKLVYYEEVENELTARKREKQLKGWLREKKIRLIEAMNSEWNDLIAPFLDGIMGKENEITKNEMKD
jgi:putative endonuclease